MSAPSIRFLLPLVLLAACRPGTDPASLLPADADAVVVMRPTAQVAARVGPLLDALPEAAGAVELLRSLAGLDLRTPERARDEGLDPSRPVAAAWWRGAVLVLAPMTDGGLATRRLALRLARLGLEEGEAKAEVRVFRRPDDRDKGFVATLRTVRDVAVVCAGPVPACLEAPFPTAGAGWSPADVAAELALPDADLAGRVAGGWISSQGPVLLGVPKAQRTSTSLALSLLGDLRWAASLDGGVRVRVAVGSGGGPVDLAPEPDGLPPGLSALVQVALPESALGLAGTALKNCGAGCRLGTMDPAPLLAGWSGTLAGLVTSGRPATPGPAVSVRDLAERLRASVLVRFRTPDLAAAAAALLAPPPAAPVSPGGTGTPIPPPAVVGPVDGAWRGPMGIEASVSAFGDLAALSLKGAVPARGLVGGARPDLLAALPTAGGDRVVRVRVDPGALLDAAGGTGIEFLRHVLGAMRLVFADVVASEGRVALDAGVRLRRTEP